MNKYYVNSFEKALPECSADELALLSRLWGMDGATLKQPRDIVKELTTRMQDPIAVRFVWEALSKDEQQVFYHALSATHEGIRRTDLLIKAHLDPNRYELAIDNLLQYLLLYEQVENVPAKKSDLPPSAAKKLAKNALQRVNVIHAFPDTMKLLHGVGQEIFTLEDRSTQTLQQLLAHIPDMWLYQVIRGFQEVSWGTDYSRADFKEKVINTLQKLSDPLSHLPTLSEDASFLYRWLREQGGRVTIQDARIHTGLSDNRLWYVLHELEHAVLAFDTFSKQERVLFIPKDISALSSDHAVKPSPTADAQIKIDTEPKTVLTAEPIILYDIAVVTNALYQYPMEPTQAGHVPKRIFNKIRPVLQGEAVYDYQDNDLYLEVLLSAMRDLRIVQLLEPPSEDVKARYEPGLRLDEWAQLDLTEQAVQLLQYWVSSGSWHDDHGVNFKPWDHYLLQPKLAREVVLRHLSKRTPGQWYTISSLLSEIWQEDPFTIRPSSVYARQVKLHKTPAIREKWDQCDAELYRGILNSTLREMGITSVGFSQENAQQLDIPINPHAFQLTEFGASVLARREESLTEKKQMQPVAPARVLIVQPNFELLLLQPDLPTLYSILPFIQVKHIGVVSRLTLTKDAVLRALSAGKSVEQIKSALEEHCQKELPQNVLYTLNDWVKNYKEARVSQVLLFEVSSEAIAQELCNVPQVKELGLRQIAPCTLVLSSDVNLQQLKRTLEKQGITVHLGRNIITRSTRSSAATYGIYQ